MKKVLVALAMVMGLGSSVAFAYVVSGIHIPKHTRSLSGSLLGYKTIP